MTASALDMARRYADIHTLALKAVSPETAAMLDEEKKLDADLQAAHERAAEVAIAAALIALGTGAVSENDVARSVSHAEVSYNAVMRPASERIVTSGMGKIYRAGKAAAARRSSRMLDVQISPSFTLVDRNAVNAMASHRIYWIGNHFETVISNRVKAVAQHEIIEGGLGGREAADAMRVALEREFGLLEAGGPARPVPIPPGWKGTSKGYFHMLASNAATTARVAGSVRAYGEAGFEKVVWETMGDQRVCEDLCEPMDGKEFLISSCIKLLDRIAAAKTPEEAKEITPWLPAEEFKKHLGGAGQISDEESEGLVEAGLALPPLHALCRCICTPVV